MKHAVLRVLMVKAMFFATNPSFAGPPSKAMQFSCLLGEATSREVSIVELPSNTFSTKERYADGYDAIYYFPGRFIRLIRQR